MYRLDAQLHPDLPRLGWFAVIDPTRGRVRAWYGPAVERGDDWLVEGVWPGNFGLGDFHTTEHVFGTGIRIADNAVHLVPSCATTDRIIYCYLGSWLLASNSLVLLLALTGADLHDDHDYRPESYASRRGIHDYPDAFPVGHPKIEQFHQLYHASLRVDSGGAERHLRTTTRTFGSFAEYTEALGGELDRISDNLADPGRRTSLTPLTTLSTGYDSTAVATLMRDRGVQTCFTSRRSNSSLPAWLDPKAALDDGTTIAEILGLDTLYLDDPTDEPGDDELYFLAPSCAEPELVFHALCRYVEKTCQGAAVFTGYHGDKIWDVGVGDQYVNDGIVRGDVSGLNLAEIRLKSGFINVAVPFIHARSMPSVMAIARSEEMVPWRLGTAYDRPIPRRIAEQAGVPRRLFGQHKKAVVQWYAYPKDCGLREDFLRDLRVRHGISPRLLPWRLRAMVVAHVAARAAGKVLPGTQAVEQHLRRRLYTAGTGVDLPQELFRWSARTLARRWECSLKSLVKLI